MREPGTSTRADWEARLTEIHRRWSAARAAHNAGFHRDRGVRSEETAARYRAFVQVDEERRAWMQVGLGKGFL